MALPKLDVPRYEMKLPSTGKKMTYRPYLVKEEKILMMAMESNDSNQMIRSIKDIIRSCTDDAIDVDAITMFDLEYIFTQLRAKSVGETANIALECQSCSEKNEVQINLSSIKVDVVKEKDRKIELTPNVGVILKYPSIDEILEIQEQGKSEVDTIFDLITVCIDSIYSNDEIFDSKDQTKEDLIEFIGSLNSDQFNKIKSFLQNMPAVKTIAVFDCSKCSTHNEIEIKGLSNFFG